MENRSVGLGAGHRLAFAEPASLAFQVMAPIGGVPEPRERFWPRGTKARLGHVARYVYWRLGGYRPYRRVRWSSVGRLVFVCTGNICRSPYAEHVARAQALDAVSVGVEASPDGVLDSTALEVARARGIPMDGHSTTPLGHFEPREGDLFIAMEPFQAAIVAKQPWAASHQITLLGLWAGSQGPVIPDPYGGDERLFNECFSVIERGIATIRRRLRVPAEQDIKRSPSSREAS